MCKSIRGSDTKTVCRRQGLHVRCNGWSAAPRCGKFRVSADQGTATPFAHEVQISCSEAAEIFVHGYPWMSVLSCTSDTGIQYRRHKAAYQMDEGSWRRYLNQRSVVGVLYQRSDVSVLTPQPLSLVSHVEISNCGQ
jgi:hypothetical protein